MSKSRRSKTLSAVAPNRQIRRAQRKNERDIEDNLLNTEKKAACPSRQTAERLVHSLY